MANWADNYVEFSGTPTNLKKLEEFFNEMIKKEEKERKGQIPDFAEEDDGYFFDTQIWTSEPETLTIGYQTRWSPNPERLVEIADHFQVNFTGGVEEPGCQIYGKFFYNFHRGKLKEIYLDDEEIEEVKYLEDEDQYEFRGDLYDHSSEIYDLILEEKVERIKTFNGFKIISNGTKQTT